MIQAMQKARLLVQTMRCIRLQVVPGRCFHQSIPALGLEEFFDPKLKPGEVIVTGRGWTAADLRRKSWDDLHKLYYVLYKERNLLLTEKEKCRKFQRPVSGKDEQRYIYVKRAMGGIKMVIAERKRLGLATEDIKLRNESIVDAVESSSEK